MKKFTLGYILFLIPFLILAQEHESSIDASHIKTLIEKYKKDVRGPYRDIRWFCKDGTINPPKEPCENGGVQHARYKDEVVALGDEYHLYFGQILASTDFKAFWDNDHYHSRMKQYMLEKYLKSVDDGWINRRAQYYRGAFQAEDEQGWGKSFFTWLLQKDDALKQHFYLIRQAAKDIPHAGDNDVAQAMRSTSKYISDHYAPFMKNRVKIHGQPEISDINEVKSFQKKHAAKLTPALNKKFDELISTMNAFFKPIEAKDLSPYLTAISNQEIKNRLKSFISLAQKSSVKTKIENATDLMWYIRISILDEKDPTARLALIDLSLKIESLIVKQIGDYPDNTINDLVDKVCYLSTAAAATGATEIWEWQQLSNLLSSTNQANFSLEELNNTLLAARKQLEWGTGKNSAIFEDVISTYKEFEPLAHGFLDDRIRSSAALYLGNAIGKLGLFINKESSLNNQVLDLNNQSHIHGLNPGYATGELVVIEGSSKNIDVEADKIYVFDRPSSDLKPVAGILTVSEGNLVSHVQLLARNLGIPNAAISSDNVTELKKYNGKKVFYAVSNKGTVIMKPASTMTREEQNLFTQKKRDIEMITVPVDQIKLDRTTILNLTEVNAKSSGIYCGPKAANLGELKENFPQHVVDGFVIPFGIFLEHMKQKIPQQNQSYWDYLNHIFREARAMKASSKPDKDIEQYQLTELKKLHKLIINMPLLDHFKSDLEQSFQNILNSKLGEKSVFLRSDTNMEDLKSFTGAGLNLTLFNVLEKEKILNGIKSVWASPYTERSFKWRQKYLTNPENVYPSIVVIPGVNNDCSGVMITKGVSSGNTDEITVAFSRGVGGAVDGQAAETWSIKNNGVAHLISPAREPFFKYLPSTGATKTKSTTFERPILASSEIYQLNQFSKILTQQMGKKGVHGPYDVELGFKNGKIWLFQVRPFVENKNAKSSSYLESITPKVNLQKTISTQTTIP